jgi:cytochrome c-type biogenesis protein CcmE
MVQSDKKRKFNAAPIFAGAVILGSIAFAAVTFKGSLAESVSFARAIKAAPSGSTVEIVGVPVKGDTKFDQGSGNLEFVLHELQSTQTMPVVFKSPKPDNFDEAVKVEAYGKYDTASNSFVADNVLVKCPSKYAGDPAATQNRSYSATMPGTL